MLVYFLFLELLIKGRKGKFPEPEIDPVITIGATLTTQGQSDPFAKVFIKSYVIAFTCRLSFN